MSATAYRLAGTVLIVRLKLNSILRRSRFPPDTTLDDFVMGTSTQCSHPEELQGPSSSDRPPTMPCSIFSQTHVIRPCGNMSRRWPSPQ